MLFEKRFWVSVVCSIVLLSALGARAETLSGTVVDPQQRPIMRAAVSLICNSQKEAQNTDDQGHFAFNRQVFYAECRLQIFYHGFATLELAIGHRRNFSVQLRLGEVKETLVVRSDALSFSSLASMSLPAEELKRTSGNSDDLLVHAKRLAGVYSGEDNIYVDGLPADHLPPTDRIELITINADPFTAEYSDGGDTHIDIVTKSAERKFRLNSSGFSLGPGVPDGLNPRLSSSMKTVSLGIAAPLPCVPLVLTSDMHLTDKRSEVPIEAIVLPTSRLSSDSVGSAQATNFNALLAVGADYSRKDTLYMNASLNILTARQTNVGVSGITLPDAGFSRDTSSRGLRVIVRKLGRRYLYMGGLVTEWLSNDLRANSSGLGVGVSGAFISGGARITSGETQRTRWTLKNVLQFSPNKQTWSVGATVSRRADRQSVIPNPFGQIQFDSLQDYILSATTGAPAGTAFIMRGNGKVQYASYTAAPFIEGELLRRSKLLLRGGLRTDYQTAGGLLASPRIAAVANLHGMTLRAGGGMFVHNWSNDIFLRVLEADGHHLRQFLRKDASLSDLENELAFPGPEIISSVAPNLTRPREWMSKVSLEKPFGAFISGAEYTWTDGSHLLGSDRLSSGTGWTDLLESNRALRKQQLHFRAQYKFRNQSFITHYESTRSFDNTDGPFSFPAIPGDIRDEWAHSSGVSPHNLSFVGNFQINGGISLSVAEAWRSSAPYNVTTGLDPTDDGLYNDRGGAPRNNGVGPSYHDLSLYAFRRFRLPGTAKQSKHNLYANFGIQAENLLGSRNYTALNPVKGSPIFGQALSALPGRSVRLSVNLGQ